MTSACRGVLLPVLLAAALALLLQPTNVACRSALYNTSSARIDGKLNVHIISHTHNDPGWLSSYVQYHRALDLDGHVIGEQAYGASLATYECIAVLSCSSVRWSLVETHHFKNAFSPHQWHFLVVAETHDDGLCSLAICCVPGSPNSYWHVALHNMQQSCFGGPSAVIHDACGMFCKSMIPLQAASVE
jgi:hypothetical protein